MASSDELTRARGQPKLSPEEEETFRTYARKLEDRCFIKAAGNRTQYQAEVRRAAANGQNQVQQRLANKGKEKEDAVAEFLTSTNPFAVLAEVADGIDDKRRLQYWLHGQMYVERVRSVRMFTHVTTADAKVAKLITENCDELLEFIRNESPLSVEAAKKRIQAVDLFEREILDTFNSACRADLQVIEGPALGLLEHVFVRRNDELAQRVVKRARDFVRSPEHAPLWAPAPAGGNGM